MGNAAIKDFADRELGQAYLDSSSNKVIHSDCVTNDKTQVVRKGNKWYSISNHDKSEQLLFSIEKRWYFSGNTHVIVDAKGNIVAILHMKRNGKAIKTLVYRTVPTFENQQEDKNVYKEKQQEKDHPKLYLYARIQTSGASKCDANYALLQVHVVYNDPDFAKFQEPPLYRAAKVTGSLMGVGFLGAVMDGSDPGGETLLAKVSANGAEIANGVDIIACICLAMAVNQTGTSARGTQRSGVV